MFEKIAESMSYKKHNPPACRQLVHLSEQFVGFLVRQRRIRFVEQKDLRVAGDRACDLGPLLGRQSAVGEQRVGETVDAERLHDLRIGGAQLRPTTTGSFTPDQHILGDGKVGEELRLLVNDGDPAPVDGRRPGMPVEHQFAVVGAFLSGDDADQSALSGAVRSGDAENFAWPDIEVEPV